MAFSINQPFFFKKNRVWRLYTGGNQFAEFFGDNSKESHYPEEWVCSDVKALNKGSNIPDEGISVLESGELFSDILTKYSYEILGTKRDKLGILVKFLDSSIRLPFQVHPTKEFAKKYFNSEFGKTEAWIIVGTGEDAAIYFGFNNSYSHEQLRRAFEKEDDGELLSMMNRFSVKVGDVFLIPGGAIHAIGKNCLLVEVQEPTDFTIQPENTCGDYILDDSEKYLGLCPEDAFKCFDMSIDSREKAMQYFKCTNEKEQNVEHLITYDDTPCFSVNKYNLDKEDIAHLSLAVYVVINGEGVLKWEFGQRKIKKGDYFFVPACIAGKITVTGKKLCLLECGLPIDN